MVISLSLTPTLSMCWHIWYWQYETENFQLINKIYMRQKQVHQNEMSMANKNANIQRFG